MISLLFGDCLEKLPSLKENSIDLVIADPPYGTTRANWDSIIPLEDLWPELNRVAKENAAILIFGTEPFSSVLRLSNLGSFKYDWIWDKKTAVGHLVAKKVPLKQHEIISVFYRKAPTYNPQMMERKKIAKGKERARSELIGGESTGYAKTYTHKYPKSILRFGVERGRHPTQKPVRLIAYFIATYSNENDTVLDFSMGSGTTGKAAQIMGRNFIGIENDEQIFLDAYERLS